MKFEGFDCATLRTKLILLDPKSVFGECIKPHTKKKIFYVSQYVDNWLYVVDNVSSDIYFLDVMCNAGIYQNGSLSSSIEVLNIFIKHAQVHPSNTYHLCCNDFDSSKVATMLLIKKIYEDELKKDEISNIQIEIESLDASEYINQCAKKFSSTFGSCPLKRSILLYVDPYNFISFNLAKATYLFCKTVYCEVLLNYYFNDFIRNRQNSKCPQKGEAIKKVIEDFCLMEFDSDPKEVMRAFIKELTTTKLKYYYYFEMQNSTRNTLYFLIYLTPNLRGLEKIKDSTNKVFGYHNFYCVSDHIDEEWINLFGESRLDTALIGAREDFQNSMVQSGRSKITFEEMEIMLLEGSFIKKTQIIDHIIKPLIASGFLKKAGKTNPRNFTEDEYEIINNNENYK